MNWNALKLALAPGLVVVSGWGLASPVTDAAAQTSACNSAPAVTDQSGYSEGIHVSTTVATFQDSCWGNGDTYTATITWSTSGDSVGGATSATGTVVIDTSDAQAGTASGTISGIPPYTESGSATGYTVHITRSAGSQTNGSFDPKTISVSDPDICGATPTAVVATEGLRFSGQVGAFEDMSANATASDYVVTIDWGDGTPTSLGTVSATSGLTLSCDDVSPILRAASRPRIVVQEFTQWVVNGSHTYAEEGPHVVAFDVVDSGNDNTGNTAADLATGDGTGPGQATVADAALGGTCQTGLSVTAGAAFSGTVAHFTDIDPGGVKADYSGTIDWGDGSSPITATISGTGPTEDVQGSHTYTAVGTYSMTIKVNDAGGSTVSIACNAANGGAFGVLGVPKLPAAGAGPAPTGGAAGILLIALALALLGGGGAVARVRRA